MGIGEIYELNDNYILTVSINDDVVTVVNVVRKDRVWTVSGNNYTLLKSIVEKIGTKIQEKPNAEI